MSQRLLNHGDIVTNLSIRSDNVFYTLGNTTYFCDINQIEYITCDSVNPLRDDELRA